MISSSFTIIAPVDSARRGELQALLDQIGASPAANPVWSGADVPGLHYACGAVLPSALGGDQLMIELAGDGTESEIVERALTHSRAGLTALFACCVGGEPAGRGDLGPYLHAHVVRAGASHVGNVGRTLAQILEEAAGTERVLQAVDDARRDGSLPDDLDAVRDVARQAWSPSSAPPRRTRRERVGFVVRLVRVVGARVAVALAAFPVTLAALVWLRIRERTDGVLEDPADPELLRRVSADDDQLGSVSNHLLSVVPIKSGRFRLTLLRTVLRILDAVARVVFDKGRLGALDSIHFAHWAIIDDGRTLLFVSNFDGSWTSYLEDFIEKAHGGLTAVWSNAVGFPRTRWLIKDGATDGVRFKNYARCSQHEEAFWYQAYPHLSVRSIDAASELRDALARGRRLPAWLAPLGERHDATTASPAVAEPDWGADAAHVQSLVLRGHGNLPASRFARFRLPDDAGAGRGWLAGIAPEVTLGPSRVDREALHLVLTASGLERLGVDREVIDSFGIEFAEGPATPHRSRILGDLGVSAPETWDWGGPDDDVVDGMLLVYAEDDAVAKGLVERHARTLRDANGSLLGDAADVRLPRDGREHFGFLDGTSQPVLAGSDRRGDQWSLVPPGELVLGLRDGSEGPVPPVPGGSGWEDLGRLGSFVVVRQLAQDVARFWATVDAVGGGAVGGDALADRMVGRRRHDGSSLVVDADPDTERAAATPAPDANDFGYAHADPEGLACPIGSHIRRANPRDTGAGGATGALRTNNRHRILRRGRVYGPPLAARAPDDGQERGLYFVGIVADIARQFEFVQQHWLNGPNFDALGEVDPLTGSQEIGSGRFSWAAQPVNARVGGLHDVVRTRGGLYGFLPSGPALARLADR